MISFNENTLNRWKEHLVELVPSLEPELASCSIDDFRARLDRQEFPDDEMLQALARTLQTGWLEHASEFTPYEDFVARYPIRLARQYQVIAERTDDGIRVVGGSLLSLEQLDHIRRFFRLPVEFVFASGDLVNQLIDQGYQTRTSDTRLAIEELDRDQAVAEMKISAGGEDLLEITGKSPVIRLTNSIIFDAIKAKASDIHIQPYEDRLQVRFRIDGVLFDQFQIPKDKQEEILSRVKVMGRMNIAEKRLPQDGRASVSVGDRNIDLRIASLPTSHGERVVVRLLDKGARLYTLEELGMSDEILNRFRRLIHQEHGLFLVTGPTGGGKSTTLYAALQEINVKDKNVVTLEDPIEYQLDGISQTQVNEKKGLTFARGLRNILRQDPDIIMIGEIRDRETAEMAIQSALTGHMVFSTLHTNDATSAVTRLLDLGIEPYLVASSVKGVLAQRLVRRICQTCIAEQTQSAGIVESSDYKLPDTLFQGEGCDACRQTGYQGRIGIFEMMLVDEAIQSLIQQQKNAADIRRVATSTGMKLLRSDGFEKIGAGLTTLDEVLRVSVEEN